MGVNFDPTIVIAVDFDGTLTKKDTLGKEKTVPDIHSFSWLKKFQEQGAYLILYTCRKEKDIQEAISISKSFGIVFDNINEDNGKRGVNKKPNADIYIDDRANDGKIRWHRIYMRLLKIKKERKSYG